MRQSLNRPIALLAAAAFAGQAGATVTVYTNRAAWLAAVGGSPATETFTSVPTQWCTSLTTQLGQVSLTVDRLTGVQFTDPGIIDFGGTNGHVLHLNHQDPSASFDSGAPRFSTLSFGAPISAFCSDFFQLGVAPPNTPLGTVTLTIGSDSVPVSQYMDASGNGFFGFVASAPVGSITFTFARSGSIVNDVFQMDNLSFGTVAAACYANCDGSTTAPLLNVTDFTCFLQKFAQGDSYANCDGSTSMPVLNVTDFTCFLQKFAQGCP
jgi:hypothetical protein